MKDRRLPIFLIIQGGCYAAFLFLDLKGDRISLSTGIKLSIILLCFLYTLNRRGGQGGKDLFLLRCALFFTLVSDIIILLLPAKGYLYGVCSFLIVQQLYGIRLKYRDNRRRGLPERDDFLTSWMLRLSTQLLLSFVILLSLFFTDVKPDSLLMVSVVYFVSLVHNVVSSICLATRQPHGVSNTIFASGLVLFLFCDINVGLFNLSGFISFTGAAAELIYRLASILMWAFYAPSQVLIAISADPVPSISTKKQKKIM